MSPPTPTPLPAATLAHKLAAARRARFVGRRAEIERFERMLDGRDEASVLFVHGPGGIGKTTLLRELARRAEARERVVVGLDARNMSATPAALRAALAEALGAELDSAPAGMVLLLDTFELMASLEIWLRDVLLPELPADALVVIAGRAPADAQWRTDPGWAALAAVVHLTPLSPDDVHSFLEARQVPPAARARAAELARGHPLALGVLADALRMGRIDVLDTPAERSELMRVLVDDAFAELTDPVSSAAADTLVTARVVSEALLADVVDAERARELYERLRRLPFVEEGEHGLLLHDLARESLGEARMARDPGRAGQIRLAISRHLMKQGVGRMGTAQRHRFCRDWVFLLRTTANAPHVDDRWFERTYVDHLAVPGPDRERDLAAMAELARAQVGERTAALVRRWALYAPDEVVVIRRRDGALHGFAQYLRLEALDPEALAADPVLAAMRGWLDGRGVDPATPVDCLRFAFDPLRRLPNAASTFGGGLLVERALGRPGRAWSFIVHHDPEVFAPLWASMPQGLGRFNFHEPMAELAVDVDGCAHEVRSLRYEGPPRAAAPLARVETDPPAPPLDRDAFASAVRDALRHFARPDRLAANPLLRTALLGTAPRQPDPPGAPAGVETLRSLLAQAVHALAEHPADLKFHHALRLTWLDPGATQERVAQELGLPFNTYRYHLGRGLERVVSALWQRELRAVATGS